MVFTKMYSNDVGPVVFPSYPIVTLRVDQVWQCSVHGDKKFCRKGNGSGMV